MSVYDVVAYHIARVRCPYCKRVFYGISKEQALELLVKHLNKAHSKM